MNTIFGPDEVRWSIRCDKPVEWFLLDRPDPLAEVVEVAAKALWGLGYTNVEWSYADPDVKIAYRDMARTVVAAIAERWELVRKRLGCE